MGKASRERRAKEREARLARFQQANRAELQGHGMYEYLMFSDPTWKSEIGDAVIIRPPAIAHIADNLLEVSIRPPFRKLLIDMVVPHGLVGILIETLDDTHLSIMLMDHPKGSEGVQFPGGWKIELGVGGNFSGRIFIPGFFTTPQSSMELEKGMINLLWITIFILGLLNCKNIVMVDNEPDQDSAEIYEREFRQPMTKYKTLAVKATSKRYEREDDQPHEYQDIVPLHIRRGNFAHYTEDAPLFGKFTGTFWRPATTVGNAKNGIVVKDYKVKPDSEAD